MPFEYVDAESGELMGFDMDLIRAIGEVLGLEVQIDNISWDGLIPALLNGNYDCLIAGITITPSARARWTSRNPTSNLYLLLWPTPEQRSPAWRGWRARPPLCRLTPPEISRPRI